MAQSRKSQNGENNSIFDPISLHLDISLTPPNGPPVIDITDGEKQFHRTFGYPADQFPMNLKDLLVHNNDGEDVDNLLSAVHACSRHEQFINLTDAKGKKLACYVQIEGYAEYFGYSSKSSADRDGDKIPRDFNAGMVISSASSVGNIRSLHRNVEPALVDPTHPFYDPARFKRFSRHADECIDQNSEAHKDTKPAKKAKAAPTTTTTDSTTTITTTDSATTTVADATVNEVYASVPSTHYVVANTTQATTHYPTHPLAEVFVALPTSALPQSSAEHPVWEEVDDSL